MEVLVALAIFSIFILVYEKMHLLLLQETEANSYFSIAQQQLKNLAADFSSNPALFSDLVTRWNKQNHELLPNGRGVAYATASHLQAILYWGKASNADCIIPKIGLSGCASFSA